jgi:chromosome partition protein MukB
VEATGRLQSAKDTESAFRVVADALGRISVRPSADADAHALALEVLHGLRQDDELVSRLPGLRAEKQTAEQLAKRQTTARQVAAKLSRLDLVLSNQGAVRHALTACSFDLDIAREDLNRAKARQAQIGIDMEAHGRRLRTLLTHREECKRLRACVDPIAARHEQPVRSSAELGALLAWLQQRSGEADGRVEKLSREVAETEGRLHELRNAGGSVPAQLATATEAVEGRLLLERFEDIPFEQAAEVEARLGPLVHAILVDDPSAAARTLASLHSAPNTVWILDGPRLDLAPGRLPGGERLGMSVAAPVETGLRLTRLPPAPVVGRQARERLIRELEGRCRVQAGQLADARDVARTLAADRDALAPTLSKAHLLDLQDLDGEVARVNSAIAELTAEKASLSVEAEAIARRVDAAKARQKALEELWPDAHLLDPPDHAETMTSLELRITSCVRAERRLETIRNDRRTLEKGLDLLRVPPPDATELARLQDVVVTETRSRTRWLTPQADLDSVCADIEALEFAEAEEAIRKDEALLTSLNKEVEVAEQRLVAARQKRDEAKEEERAAEGHVRKTAATLQASDRRLANLEQDLERTGVEDASDESLEQARGAAAQASQCLGVAASATRRAGEVVARLEPQLTAAEGTLRTATQDREEKEAQAAPASERWASLRTKCEDLGFLDAALTDPALNEVAGKASIDVFQLRQRWWAVMLDRIGHATGGLQLSGLLQAVTGNTPEVGSEQFLRAWLETRAWLANRVPKHVSEVSDPVDALRRLRRYLDRLVDDLDGYEHRLRGDSKDIARAIEGRLRKVSNLLATLNGNLTGVGFGSIAAIQVKSERETRMNEVLTALSSEEEQARLFGTEMTIEEALNALFLRHGGRRDGGAKLLDYREYLRLRVEVKRRGGGSEPWEEARGNQMSTGESIGVGAAIMMVVLTAWERDASLLRARRESGTLRFLFLDEATRLSLDNLEILFDLCKTLDLQLLIAAPEVATSSGNTTYLLERTTDAEGRRVVQVSGRRAIRKGA